MTLWIAGACLLGGSFISLLASIGVLRLPDVFMRMHAATKSGVVGCGLILVAVALLDGSAATGVKVTVAVAFLLFTTPVAGHVLGRAAYVSGAPLWPGTVDDQLASVLQRRQFGFSELPAAASITTTERPAVQGITRVVVALVHGPHMTAAIKEAISLAQQHGAELCGIALIDAPRLSNVGPVPAGAGSHAADLRKWRIRNARQAAADVIQTFESHAKVTALQWSVRVEEGRPHKILRAFRQPGSVVAIPPSGGFDQGVLGQNANVVRRLVDKGVYPLLVLGRDVEEVDRIRFIHDGSQRSFNTWLWLLETQLWPDATLLVGTNPGVEGNSLEQLVHVARSRGRRVEQTECSGDPREHVVVGNSGSRSWLPGWLAPQQAFGVERVLVLG